MTPIPEHVLERLLAEQPSPSPLGAVDGQPIVETLLNGVGRRFPAPVIDGLLARLKTGIERYGTPLYSHNRRDPLADGFQESLDAVVYYYQAWLEADNAFDKQDLLELVESSARNAMLAYQVAAGREGRRRAAMEDRRKEDQAAGRRTPARVRS